MYQTVERNDPALGVSIIDHGLVLAVVNGKAKVSYNSAHAEYFVALKTGTLDNGDTCVTLRSDQLTWLKDQRGWVDSRLADDRP